MQKHSKHLAERVKQDQPESSLDEQVKLALKLALQRDADPDTVTDGLALIDKLQTAHGLDSAEALNQYCLMVLNLNEFVYLD